MHAGTSLELATVGIDHAWATYVVPPAGANPYISRTADGGATWPGVDTPIEESRLGNAIRFTDPDHGFSADDFGFFGARGLFATDDGGVTWAERKVPLPDGVAREQASYGLPRFFGRDGVLPVGIVEPDRSQPARDRVAFYRSDDAGATWRLAAITPVATASDVQAVVAAPDVWWAADGSGSRISITADGGRTWTEHRPDNVAVLHLIDASDQTAAIASGTVGSTSGLVVTRDNRPEIVATTLGPEPGRWFYTAYRLAGGHSRTAGTGTGREPAERHPAGIHFGAELHCDGLSA